MGQQFVQGRQFQIMAVKGKSFMLQVDGTDQYLPITHTVLPNPAIPAEGQIISQFTQWIIDQKPWLVNPAIKATAYVKNAQPNFPQPVAAAQPTQMVTPMGQQVAYVPPAPAPTAITPAQQVMELNQLIMKIQQLEERVMAAEQRAATHPTSNFPAVSTQHIYHHLELDEVTKVFLKGLIREAVGTIFECTHNTAGQDPNSYEEVH
jgi:hypothetical protein